VLDIATQVRALRDDRHQAGRSRKLLGEPPRPHNPPLHVKRQRFQFQFGFAHSRGDGSVQPIATH